MALSLTVLRLFFLQVIERKKYSTLAEQNRVRVSPIPAPRGRIYDRNGVLLADNRLSFQLIYQKQPKEVLAGQLHFIQKCLKTPIELQTTQNQAIIARRLLPDELICLSHYQDQLPSFTLESRPIRYYPWRHITSHLLGYIAPPTAEQIDQFSPAEKKAIRLTGRQGLERELEPSLRGQAGWIQEEVNAKGQVLRQIDRIPPHAGEDMTLTLDIDLQRMAYEALSGYDGAFVVLDVESGDLLAMASTPSYDANAFSHGIPKTLFKELLDDPRKPLYPRATQGLYPPASTIKPYLGLAALAEGRIQAQDRISDPGWFRIEGSQHVFHDWKRQGHGIVDLERAITVSCDVYFYALSLKLGIDKMEAWLQRFGFGEPLTLPLSARSGLLPSPAWKKHKGQRWGAGDTVITGIGQGALLATPLQQAVIVSRLAMRGAGKKLRILMETPILDLPTIDLPAKHWDLMHRAMRQVVEHPEGTMHALHTLAIPVAGKTGTAQVVSLDRQGKHRKHQDHHWVVGFAPMDNPKIAFAILIEHEHVAVSVLKHFLNAWNP